MAHPQIAALLLERERHVLANREDRIADIDAEIKALGGELETAEAPRASKRAK